MVALRLRRWPSIETALSQRLVPGVYCRYSNDVSHVTQSLAVISNVLSRDQSAGACAELMTLR